MRSLFEVFRIAGFCAALFAIDIAYAANQPEPADIHFQVLRNGTPFGEHRVSFTRTPDGELRVDTEIELTVRFGPLTVFRYEQSIEEAWEGDDLISLAGETLRNGREYTIDLGRDSAFTDLIPSSHWRGYQPGTEQILNTETGEPMAVTITELGRREILTGRGLVEARGVRMTGSLSVDLWYDTDGEWIGCEFEVDGQSVRYVLL
ncbi:DUF6134 family protein [Maricaulis sp.]|uniref:DUF6134 family protein n=1 Tax=Maricaulis sp. TaxID=1486257 RepID=UPI003A91B44D